MELWEKMFFGETFNYFAGRRSWESGISKAKKLRIKRSRKRERQARKLSRLRK